MDDSRPHTPNIETRALLAHYSTPTKASVWAAVHFADRMKLPYYKEDIFRTFNVSRTRGYEMLRNEDFSSRQLHNNPDHKETRGRKSLISSVKIREMERILEEEGIEARSLTWQQLGYEVGLDCSGRTIQRAMGTMDYHKCVSCKKGWVNERTAAKRVEWATFMLNKYPEKED